MENEYLYGIYLDSLTDDERIVLFTFIIPNIYERLLYNNNSKEKVIGKGIIKNSETAFDKDKLKEVKPLMATLFNSLGIDNVPFVGLASIAYKWNKLSNRDDFYKLDKIITCASACGFIRNDDKIMEINTRNLEFYSDLINQENYELIYNNSKDFNFKEWLKSFRVNAITRMFYSVNEDKIKKYVINSNEKVK